MKKCISVNGRGKQCRPLIIHHTAHHTVPHNFSKFLDYILHHPLQVFQIFDVDGFSLHRTRVQGSGGKCVDKQRI